MLTHVDSTIAVDWSGNAADRGQTLWLAHCVNGELVELRNGRTRRDVLSHVIELLARHPATVVGLDFSFGFPEWFNVRLGWTSALDMWADVGRNGEAWLHACEAPFWGRPGRRRGPESQFRRTEHEVAARWNVHPSSTFQIGGAGAVGTGSLRGMPFLTALHAAGATIQSFAETDRGTGAPIVVELYPRLLTGPVVKRSATARAAHLARFAPPDGRTSTLHSDLLERAKTSEDAFDAAVSAIEMFRHRASFSTPSPRAVGESRPALPDLEGAIWEPPPERG